MGERSINDMIEAIQLGRYESVCNEISSKNDRADLAQMIDGFSKTFLASRDKSFWIGFLWTLLSGENVLNDMPNFKANLMRKLFRFSEKFWISLVKILPREEMVSVIHVLLQRGHILVLTHLIEIKACHPLLIALILTVDDKQGCYITLLRLGLSRYMISFVRELASLSQKGSVTYTGLSPEEGQLLESFKAIKSDDVDAVTEIMSAFVNKTGSTLKIDGLLAISAIKHSKRRYLYEPILVMQEEISEYFHILQQAKKPLSELFVYRTANHSSCGKVEIDEAGQVKLFYLDSLGVMSEFMQRGVLAVFPEAQIFYTNFKRQYTSGGCFLFAVDDVMHLSQIKLPAQYNGDLFLYLENNVVKMVASLVERSSFMKVCRLPLSFMRLAQSSDLGDEISKRDLTEQNTPVNKTGELAATSAMRFFKSTSILGEKSNQRVAYKLAKLAQKVWTYLLANLAGEVADETEYFTVKAFGIRKLGEAGYAQLKQDLMVHPPPSRSTGPS